MPDQKWPRPAKAVTGQHVLHAKANGSQTNRTIVFWYDSCTCTCHCLQLSINLKTSQQPFPGFMSCRGNATVPAPVFRNESVQTHTVTDPQNGSLESLTSDMWKWLASPAANSESREAPLPGTSSFAPKPSFPAQPSLGRAASGALPAKQAEQEGALQRLSERLSAFVYGKIGKSGIWRWC